jgi:hypothetical protein
MRKSKRVISKSKTYGFNPWVDQVDAINQIMEETGAKAESVVLRKLIDEALGARRKTRSEVAISEAPSGQGFGETLQTIQSLLLKLVRQGETSLRIQDVNLALLQDTLAEAYAARKVSWSIFTSASEKHGFGQDNGKEQFDEQTKEAKNYAYGVAEEIKRSQAG